MIKFTCEISEMHISFLDTAVHLSEDGYLRTDLYTKPTDAHSYLRYESSHPSHCKSSLPYSQFLRLRRICSRMDDFEGHSLEMYQHFQNRGYPDSILQQAYLKACQKDRDDLLVSRIKPKDDHANDTFAISTYHPTCKLLV